MISMFLCHPAAGEAGSSTSKVADAQQGCRETSLGLKLTEGLTSMSLPFLQLSDSPTEISDAPFLQKQNHEG